MYIKLYNKLVRRAALNMTVDCGHSYDSPEFRSILARHTSDIRRTFTYASQMRYLR